MAKKKTQLTHLAKYNLRLDPDLKLTLAKLAKARPRSLNAEIVERLEESLVTNPGITGYTDGELIDELIRRHGLDRIFIQIGKQQE